MKKIVLFFALALLLCGCATQEQPVAETIPTARPTVAPTEVPVTMPPAVEVEALAMVEAPAPAVGVVLEAIPSGQQEARCDDAVVDYSHTEDGYVMARYTSQTEKRLKLRVIGPTTTYTYNLPVDQWTVFPLSDGNGSYTVAIYINTRDSKYATVMTTSFQVELKDEFAPFLRTGQCGQRRTALRRADRSAGKGGGGVRFCGGHAGVR